MIKINLKKKIVYFSIILIVFLLDRFSKLYILNLAEVNNSVDIYINSFLNLYLIWNKGIAFGLFSFEKTLIYNFITFLIILINFFIVYLIITNNNYQIYFLTLILGGSLGNLFDRLYYKSVPDFIDFHINEYHWFIFNVADIFICLGVICLILLEIFFTKKIKNEID
jgi:signal peptidase II